MADALAINHDRIWLQPLCCVDERCWCQDPQDCGDEGCELPAIGYIRADLVAELIMAARAACETGDRRKLPALLAAADKVAPLSTSQRAEK